MKGIAHFLSGIAAASFIPAAVQQSATRSSDYLIAPLASDTVYNILVGTTLFGP
jgi:hypothetical protein